MTDDRAQAELLRAILSHPEDWSFDDVQLPFHDHDGDVYPPVRGYRLAGWCELTIDGEHARRLPKKFLDAHG